MTTEKYRVITNVALEEIKVAPFNPPTRTKPLALKQLRDDIEHAGEIIVPLVVSADGYLADGHRRLAIAKELGYSHVPVVYNKMKLTELWSNLNSGVRKPSPADWMSAYSRGLPADDIASAKVRADVLELRRVAGEELFAALAERNRSPNILTMAATVGRYLGDESDEMLRAIIVWFETCHMQFMARKAVEVGVDPELIWRAIHDGQPIAMHTVWSVG